MGLKSFSLYSFSAAVFAGRFRGHDLRHQAGRLEYGHQHGRWPGGMWLRCKILFQPRLFSASLNIFGYCICPGLRRVSRVRRGGLVWAAPKCSSWVSACFCTEVSCF